MRHGNNKLQTLIALLVVLLVPPIILIKVFGPFGLGPLAIAYGAFIVYTYVNPNFLNIIRPSFKVIPRLDRAREVLGRDDVLFYPPKKGTKLSAGIDVALQYPITIDQAPVTVDLCFAAKVPDGYGAFILPRSGMGSKSGFRLRNTLSLIDSDFPGSWRATIVRDQWEEILGSNFDLFEDYEVKFREGPVEIPAGTYLFQIAILPYNLVDVEIMPEHYKIKSKTRNEVGHGSTDKNVVQPIPCAKRSGLDRRSPSPKEAMRYCREADADAMRPLK